MRKVDSRENEDHEDFILMSDDYLRTTQAVDEKYKAPEDERARMNSSGGFSWLGTEEDREDFAMMNHDKEDDIMKLKDELLLKEDDWNLSYKVEGRVLTILTLPERSHEDLR